MANPEFIIDSDLDGEVRTALENVKAAIEINPTFAQQSFDIFWKDPEAVSEVVTFLSEHPEGLSLLNNWGTVMRGMHDLTDLAFDETSETVIEQDPFYKKVRREFKDTKSEGARSQMRKRRLHLFMGRVADNAA